MALPKKVQQATDQADATHAEVYNVVEEVVKDDKIKEAAAADAAAKETADATAEAAADAQASPALAEVEKEKPPLSDKEIQKHKTLKGKYDAEVPRLHEENEALRTELGSMQATIANLGREASVDIEADASDERFLDDEEIEDYGEDLIGMVKRAAREEISPELYKLQKENKTLRDAMGTMSDSLVKNAQSSIYRQLYASLPNWKEINESEPFLAWLGQSDVYSGVSRQSLLTRAFEQSDAARVLKFFEGYLTEQTVVQAGTQTNDLDTLVAPGRSAASDAAGATPKGQIWTSAQVEAFFRAVNNGDYKDDPKLKAAYDEEIIAAGREGRIIN